MRFQRNLNKKPTEVVLDETFPSAESTFKQIVGSPNEMYFHDNIRIRSHFCICMLHTVCSETEPGRDQLLKSINFKPEQLYGGEACIRSLQ